MVHNHDTISMKVFFYFLQPNRTPNLETEQAIISIVPPVSGPKCRPVGGSAVTFRNFTVNGGTDCMPLNGQTYVLSVRELTQALPPMNAIVDSCDQAKP